MFDLDRIKAIPIAIVAKDLGFTLSRGGGGCCRLPDHDDTEPSFSIRQSTNRFTCFGCGKRGSVIDLVELMQGLNFKEACQFLDQRYLGGAESRPGDRRGSTRRLPAAGLRTPPQPDASKRADAEVYEWLLQKSPLRTCGAEYLASRGFTPQTIERFRVGQMPDRNRMLQAATTEFGIKRLRDCGLAKVGKLGAEMVFPTNYLLFPFLIAGRVTYLQARRPDRERKWRWFCLADLPPPLFNADALTRATRTITLCEGVTDVLSAHELGMEAVGVLGASAPLDAETALRFRGRNLAVVGDADTAGGNFNKRVRDVFAPLGLTVVPKRLPPGCNDLNDYLLAKRKRAHELA